MNFSGIIINKSPDLESIFVHKSLDTIERSSIFKNFTSDNLLLKEFWICHLNRVALFQV